METIAAHVILGVEIVWNGIHVSVVGHGGMESVVEHAYLGNAGHQVVNGADTLQVACVVNGCEVAKAANAKGKMMCFIRIVLIVCVG